MDSAIVNVRKTDGKLKGEFGGYLVRRDMANSRFGKGMVTHSGVTSKKRGGSRETAKQKWSSRWGKKGLGLRSRMYCPNWG